MADSPAKRQREAKKREYREMKAERKKLRKAGLLGVDAPLGPDGLPMDSLVLDPLTGQPLAVEPPAAQPPTDPTGR